MGRVYAIVAVALFWWVGAYLVPPLAADVAGWFIGHRPARQLVLPAASIVFHLGMGVWVLSRLFRLPAPKEIADEPEPPPIIVAPADGKDNPYAAPRHFS